MTMNAGVWIDHDKAIVVLLTDEGQEMLQIRSDQAASARSSAGLRRRTPQTPNDFVGEANRDQNMVSRRNEYYDQIIACVRNAQAILVLGPERSPKREFRRRIAARKSEATSPR